MLKVLSQEEILKFGLSCEVRRAWKSPFACMYIHSFGIVYDVKENGTGSTNNPIPARSRNHQLAAVGKIYQVSNRYLHVYWNTKGHELLLKDEPRHVDRTSNRGPWHFVMMAMHAAGGVV